MKTLKKLAHVLGLFVLLATTTTLVRAQDYENDYQDDGYSTGNVSLQTFYDELSPYGTWIQDPQYGYVWRPDVDQSDFRPYYTNGRWAMTEYGNTWVSNYDWGWAPFHYGRWVINSYRQWIWLPDTTWGPAWVDWRSGGGYYGWAPMGPSISINLSFGRRYVVPEFCWNFIPQSNIYINVFPRYNYARNNVYIRNTTIINNTYVYNKRSYYGGPRIEDIRRATNRDVTVYRYSRSSSPGASRIGGREVSIYRPRPQRDGENRTAAPRKFEQGSAGFSRGGRNEGYATRDSRGGNNNNRATQSSRGNDASATRPGNQSNTNRDDVYNRNSNRPTRGNTNGTEQRGQQENSNRGQDQQRWDQARQQRSQADRVSQNEQRTQRDAQVNQQRNEQAQQQRSQQAEQQRAQRNEQMQQQRSQQQAEQQRAQRSEQMQQQRSQQAEQQRAQRNEQMQQQRNQQAEQQRAQRNEQMQQQRAQQAEQQRAQRDAQQQQQRSQQAEQQRAQRNEQMQQQRQQQQQQQQQQRSSEGGRSSRAGRG